MAKAQLFSGARGQIKYNGVTLAFFTDANVQVTDNVAPTYVVGELHPVTLEPLSYDVTVSIGRVIPMNKSDGTPLNQVDGFDLGLEPRIIDVLNNNAVEIDLVDKQKNVVMAQIMECRFTGRTTNMGSNDIANERYNFVGIYDAVAKNSPQELGYGFDSNP